MIFPPSRSYAKVLRLKTLALALPLAFALGFLYRFNHIPALILSVGIFVLFCLVWTVYIPLSILGRQTELKSNRLIISYGVIIRRRHILPLSRAIYCKINNGPIYRLFGLSTVKIHLVGAEISIKGLDCTRAEKLVSYLEGKK